MWYRVPLISVPVTAQFFREVPGTGQVVMSPNKINLKTDDGWELNVFTKYRHRYRQYSVTKSLKISTHLTCHMCKFLLAIAMQFSEIIGLSLRGKNATRLHSAMAKFVDR